MHTIFGLIPRIQDLGQIGLSGIEARNHPKNRRGTTNLEDLAVFAQNQMTGCSYVCTVAGTLVAFVSKGYCMAMRIGEVRSDGRWYSITIFQTGFSGRTYVRWAERMRGVSI